MNTPPGFRAKQTMDMLNSDWPIGTGRCAHPGRAGHGRTRSRTAMDSLWWDRPFTVAGVDFGAGARHAAPADVVRGRPGHRDCTPTTNSMVDRFDVRLQTPEIKSWADVDAELTNRARGIRIRSSKVDGRPAASRWRAPTPTESLPLASIFKLYVLLAVADAVKAGTLSLERPAHHHRRRPRLSDRRTSTNLPPGATGFGAHRRAEDDRQQRQHGHRPADRAARHRLPSNVRWSTAGHHDPASMTPFPTMHELFSVGWGEPDLREQWKNAVSAAQPGAQLLRTDEFPSLRT